MYWYAVAAGFIAGEWLGGLARAISQAAQGLGATTGLQWDVQTLTIGADAIEEIFLPFRQAHENSAAISATLCYYLDLRVSCAASAASRSGNSRPIRSISVSHPPNCLTNIEQGIRLGIS
jgi:hypothetical protein